MKDFIIKKAAELTASTLEAVGESNVSHSWGLIEEIEIPEELVK